jgi:hypothetical protein
MCINLARNDFTFAVGYGDRTPKETCFIKVSSFGQGCGRILIGKTSKSVIWPAFGRPEADFAAFPIRIRPQPGPKLFSLFLTYFLMSPVTITDSKICRPGLGWLLGATNPPPGRQAPVPRLFGMLTSGSHDAKHPARWWRLEGVKCPRKGCCSTQVLLRARFCLDLLAAGIPSPSFSSPSSAASAGFASPSPSATAVASHSKEIYVAEVV